MTVEQLTILVRALAIVLGLIATYIIKPYIDSKISQTEQETLKKYIEMGVRCAQQIYTPEEWEQKKSYVMGYVKDIMKEKLKIELSDKEISTLIESAVYELKKG